MIDYKLANLLAKEAFEFWSGGQLADAAERYARAIEIAETYPDWRGQYAGVLDQLGRHEDAARQYEAWVVLALKESGAVEAAPGVRVARCLFSDFLTRLGEPQRALEVLAPALSALPDDWLIASARARALFAASRFAEARTAAKHAMANAPTEAKRVDLSESLQEILRGVARNASHGSRMG